MLALMEVAQSQLAALAEVGESLDRAGIEYWLFGGWAVDFCAGVVTRAHGDIDLAVWAHDAEAIGALLRTNRWRHRPKPDENGGTGYERQSVRIELTFLASDDSRRVFITFRDQDGLWSEQPLGNKTIKLRGVHARLIPLAVLKRDKSTPRDDAARDRADSQVLSSVSS